MYAGVDPETGRQCYRTATVRGTRAEAERELAALVAAIRAEGAGGASSPLSVLLERWFSVASRSWAPTTIRQTRSVLDRYLHSHVGSIPVGRLTAARIDELYAELGRSGGVKGQPLSAGTVARVHVVYRSALAQAVRWGWIWDNPAQRTHRITVSTRELHPPTPAELEALLAHVAQHDPQFHVFLVLAAFTGARRAQLLGLRWDNVSLTAERVSFRAGWVEGPDGPVLADTKTRRSHVVDLDPGTCEIVARYAATVGSPVGEGFVFSDDDGATAWKPNRVTKAFGRHRKAVGLRPFRLHDLRHFMATQMLEAGVSTVIVSRRLDHRRVSTTLDRYAHAVPGGDAQASATLRTITETAATPTAVENGEKSRIEMGLGQVLDRADGRRAATLRTATEGPRPAGDHSRGSYLEQPFGRLSSSPRLGGRHPLGFTGRCGLSSGAPSHQTSEVCAVAVRLDLGRCRSRVGGYRTQGWHPDRRPRGLRPGDLRAEPLAMASKGLFGRNRGPSFDVAMGSVGGCGRCRPIRSWPGRGRRCV